MRVLFQIPKTPPPQLAENHSKSFREFVEACLQKNPEHVGRFERDFPCLSSFNIRDPPHRNYVE